MHYKACIHPYYTHSPFLLPLYALFMLQFFDPVSEAYDPGLFKHQALREVLWQCVVDGVLDLV